MQRPTRLLFSILALLGAAYLGLCGLMYATQTQQIFPATARPADYLFPSALPHRDVYVDVPGARLHGLHFFRSEAKGVVLYLHGNGDDVFDWAAIAPEYLKRGYDVLLIDYRGYGRSTGRIESEAQLHADMAAVYTHVRAQYAPERITIVGRSIGSGLAARLARDFSARQLILETPYYSLESLIARRFWFLPVSQLLRFPLRTDAWLPEVRCPVLIVHGTRDEVIPYDNAERLQQLYPRSSLVTLPGARHGGFTAMAEYQQAMDRVFP